MKNYTGHHTDTVCDFYLMRGTMSEELC